MALAPRRPAACGLLTESRWPPRCTLYYAAPENLTNVPMTTATDFIVFGRHLVWKTIDWYSPLPAAPRDQRLRLGGYPDGPRYRRRIAPCAIGSAGGNFYGPRLSRHSCARRLEDRSSQSHEARRCRNVPISRCLLAQTSIICGAGRPFSAASPRVRLYRAHKFKRAQFRFFSSSLIFRVASPGSGLGCGLGGQRNRARAEAPAQDRCADCHGMLKYHGDIFRTSSRPLNRSAQGTSDDRPRAVGSRRKNSQD